MKKTICHRDGRVSYWSVYEQCWVEKACQIPDRELAVMNRTERWKVQRNLGMYERKRKEI